MILKQIFVQNKSLTKLQLIERLFLYPFKLRFNFAGPSDDTIQSFFTFTPFCYIIDEARGFIAKPQSFQIVHIRIKAQSGGEYSGRSVNECYKEGLLDGHCNCT